MALRERQVTVTFSMPDGLSIVLDQTLNLNVNIEKVALAGQNQATIEVTNLSSTVRQSLLSQFTAFRRRIVNSGALTPDYYVNVAIEAGYKDSSSSGLSGSAARPGFSNNESDQTQLIYKGQVVQVDPVDVPPNVTTRITCLTNQIDKTRYSSGQAPTSATYREIAIWAGGVMGFDPQHIRINTKYADQIIYNPPQTRMIAHGLLWWLQECFSPFVFAWIDDDYLYITDAYAATDSANTPTFSELLGVPEWNEFGCEVQVFIDPNMRPGSGFNLQSILNPSLNGYYVATRVKHEITSRQNSFYTRIIGVKPS